MAHYVNITGVALYLKRRLVNPSQQAGKIAKKMEEGVFVESALKMQCHIHKNTLLHIAFSGIFAGWDHSVFKSPEREKFI